MLKKINNKGEVLQKIGGEVGQVPGEFNQVNKFDVDAQGNYYFLDQGRRAILQFNADGLFQKNLIQFTKEVPWHFSVVGDKIILDFTNAGERFQVFDLKGNIITKFFDFTKQHDGNMEKKDHLIGTALTASTASNTSDEFVVVHVFTDMVIHCKKELRNCTTFRGIDEMPLPEVITNYADGGIYIKESERTFRYTEEVATVGNALVLFNKHITKTKQKEFGKGLVFDVYDLSTHTYDYSFKMLNKSFSSFDISNNLMAIVNGSTLSVYQIEKP